MTRLQRKTELLPEREVAEVAGWVSPNPGGVGPMTRAMLLVNTIEAAELSTVAQG